MRDTSILLAAALLCAGMTAASSGSLAHTKLTSASPPANATVKSGLTGIKLVFSEEIEPSLSAVELKDAAGAVISTSKGTNACEANICALTIAPLKAGDYRVIYHVLSPDSHVVDGSYGFHIAD